MDDTNTARDPAVAAKNQTLEADGLKYDTSADVLNQIREQIRKLERDKAILAKERYDLVLGTERIRKLEAEGAALAKKRDDLVLKTEKALRILEKALEKPDQSLKVMRAMTKEELKYAEESVDNAIKVPEDVKNELADM